MRTVCIVHFQPIEKYPPAINLLRAFTAQNTGAVRIHVITIDPGMNKEKISIPGVSIHRVATWKERMSKLRRIVFYLHFNIKAFFILVGKKPSAILYYETLSAGGPCIYKRLFRTHLLVHYHEYTSPGEYNHGMILNRWLHKLELRAYKKMSWVSHTNQERLIMFLKDCGEFAPVESFILPNYPPVAWNRKLPATNRAGSGKIGFVYVGALDTETMYLQEMAKYIAARSESCYWDIYSANYSGAAKEFLDSLGAGNIHFKGYVPYDGLPGVLRNYNIGLILYNGHIPNYIFNVPNKLFEYVVCGLDVWFPDIMVSSLPFKTIDTWPKIVPLDFTALEKCDISAVADRGASHYKPWHFEYESVLQPFLSKLCES